MGHHKRQRFVSIGRLLAGTGLRVTATFASPLWAQTAAPPVTAPTASSVETVPTGAATVDAATPPASAAAAVAEQAADPAASTSAGDIVVTGSRLARDGARAPTPVTVASAEQLSLAAPGTITQALTQLPAFKGSVSPQSQGTATTGNNGGAFLNLRGLGTSRTLVLLDGRRVVGATSAGSVDVAQLPEALVRQVEIVTGGASAAYGSDAVSGVVNFLLDTKMTGLKASLQSGISGEGDNFNWKGTLAGGTGFAEGRGHVIASFEYYSTDGIPQSQARSWAFRGRGLIPNPNVTAANPASPTNPRQLLVDNPYSSVASLGGLITNTALRGTSFGPGGTVQPFQYGQFVSATQMAGGGGYNPNLLLVLQPEQTRAVGFTHASFDVSEALTVYAEASYGRNHIEYNSLPTFELSNTAFTIFQDNAYLPASVRTQMQALGLASVTVGRISPDIAIPRLDGTSKTQRYVGGFDGKIGEDWRYGGYYQYGRTHALFQTLNDPISDNLYRAADAVAANGTIVCRSTIANPGNGCVPLNIFGQGSPSAGSIAYILGTAIQEVVVKQQVAEANIRGDLFDLPGGKLGVAFGAGYRKESFDQTTDAISSRVRTGVGINGYPPALINTLGGFERTNPQPSAGEYDVKEVFGEINAPLLADLPFARSLTLSGAVRYTDYSTSGGVTSWKVGGVYEPVRGLRFRATQSRDIRAASLGELFQGSSQATATVVDPQRGGATSNVLTGNVGNPALVPEKADTTVVGIVLQPAAVPRFSLSVDYYNIRINQAISSLTAQQQVNLCQSGATELCGFIQRNAQNVITRIALPFLNVANRDTRGIDAEASWTMPLADGTLGFRLLVNYLDKFETQVGANQSLQLAGDIGVNSTPKWSGTLSASYNNGGFGLFVQERYIGSGKFDATLTTTDLAVNHVPAVFYTDATATFDIGAEKRAQFFATVNNLFDRDPPRVPGFLIAGSNLGNRILYDVVGRAFTVGVRIKM